MDLALNALKEAMVHPFLKRTSLDHYCSISNIPFLGKVLEGVVAGQPQMFLEDCLDLFQSGFKTGFGTKTALIALTIDLQGGLLIFLNPSVAFSTIYFDILRDKLSGMGMGSAMLWWVNSYLWCQFQ